jgi:phage gp45-like
MSALEQFRGRVREFAGLIGPIQRSVRLMISRGLLMLVDDTQTTQEVQLGLLAGEVLSGLEHFQPYGFTSNPFPGAEAVFLSVAGNRTQGIVVVIGDKRYRITGLQSGEVCLHDDQGQTIIIRRNGIVITTKMQVTVNAPTTIYNGNIQVNGGITTTEDVVAANVSLIKHLHSGVQPGSGQSAAPIAGG